MGSQRSVEARSRDRNPLGPHKMITSKIFNYALLGAVVLVAAVAGAWYLLAPPDGQSVAMPGRIEGTTFYPSDFNPAQTVCAQSLDDKTVLKCVDVPEQVGSAAPKFSIKVPAGRYYVYAILEDPSDLGLSESTKAYWTEFVRCGLKSGCPSHQKLEVIVGSGQTIIDIKPHDWYSR
jgi:hypothetical protein